MFAAESELGEDPVLHAGTADRICQQLQVLSGHDQLGAACRSPNPGALVRPPAQ